jgi:hypothetical protein
MCIRDAEGCFVLAKTTWFSPLCSVDVGEAFKLSQALQRMANLGFVSKDFSIDLKIVVDTFNGDNNNNNEFGSIIHHCR